MSSPPSSSSPPPPPAAVPFPSTESESEPETTTTPTPEDAGAEPAPEPPKPKDLTAEILDEAKKRFEDQSTADGDLRDTVGKLITLCTKLTARISTLEPQLTELQTSLTLTQSNLTLAMANTEMLEDALKHNSHTRDVGWRRSDSTASRRPPTNSISYSTSSITSGGSIDEHGARIVVHAPSPQSPPPRAATTTPTGQGESRFFRFRFGSKTPSPTAAVHQAQMNKAASPPPSASHLTSASLPSLGLALEEVPPTPPSTTSATSTGAKVPDPELVALEKKLKEREEEIKAKEESILARDKELEELKAKLEAEKKVSAEVEKEKAKVQEEIENLTQSLFEEANKMVADERRKMAEVEALLRETEEERDAVRGAMRVVEGENGRLRELSAGAAKNIEEEKAEKAEEDETKTEDVDQAPVKVDGEAEPDSKAPEPEKPVEPQVEPEAPAKPDSDRVESPITNEPKSEPQDDAESGTDNARTSFESARADSVTKESSPIVSPVSSDDEAEEPTPSDGHLAKPVTAIPSLPGSSSDLWKGQARDREVTPPKTPPRVHTLPVETSPWAEGRA